MPQSFTSSATTRFTLYSAQSFRCCPLNPARSLRAANVSRVTRCCADTAQNFHFSMCTNKTCKKQGCMQVIQFARDLSLPEIEVETCGCLGVCGNGPNMMLDPPGTQLSHVSSPAKFVEVLDLLCDIKVPPELLKATELRLQGNAEARGGDLKAAEAAYSKALALEVATGKHLLHANRSGVRLSLGNADGALEDAKAAVKLAPSGFTTAHVRLVEALSDVKQYKEALKALEVAAQQDKEFAKGKEMKLMQRQLHAAIQ